MSKRVIIATLVALTLVGAGIAIGSSVDGGWGRHHDTVVVSGAGTGATDGGQTIVVTGGHGAHGFFFPFGLLFLALVVFLIAAARRRGPGGGGCRPGSPGGPPGGRGGPPWLEEWHRRAHEPEETAGPDQPAPA